VVENWNSTNEFICYGRQGEMATNSREQQEATTLSLQLLQNCLMLINTILIGVTTRKCANCPAREAAAMLAQYSAAEAASEELANDLIGVRESNKRDF
jgi:hypothetical protein